MSRTPSAGQMRAPRTLLTASPVEWRRPLMPEMDTRPSASMLARASRPWLPLVHSRRPRSCPSIRRAKGQPGTAACVRRAPGDTMAV